MEARAPTPELFKANSVNLLVPHGSTAVAASHMGRLRCGGADAPAHAGVRAGLGSSPGCRPPNASSSSDVPTSQAPRAISEFTHLALPVCPPPPPGQLSRAGTFAVHFVPSAQNRARHMVGTQIFVERTTKLFSKSKTVTLPLMQRKYRFR